VFNIQGSEIIFLLLIALIVLGPEKLPDAIRKFGRAYAEFKKMANGFQGELKQALDEPMRELKDTADAMRAAVNFDADDSGIAPVDPGAPPEAPPVKREQGLNFGTANPRRKDGAAKDGAANDGAAKDGAAAPAARPQGLNFGTANPQRTRAARDPLAPIEPPADTPADLPATADADGAAGEDGT